MAHEETLAQARSWCNRGVDWIKKGVNRMAINYLDKAIGIFAEAGQIAWLTYARHHKLLGLQQMGLHDEAEILADEVLAGYGKEDAPNGKALLLAALADSQVELGRPERARTRLHLAKAIALANDQNDLKTQILVQQARLLRRQKQYAQAATTYKEAVATAQQLGWNRETGRLRYELGEVLYDLGEIGEALAVWEDVQNSMRHQGFYRIALEALKRLKTYYHNENNWEDEERTTQLVHYCGQYMLKKEEEIKEPPLRIQLGVPSVEEVASPG